MHPGDDIMTVGVTVDRVMSSHVTRDCTITPVIMMTSTVIQPSIVHAATSIFRPDCPADVCKVVKVVNTSTGTIIDLSSPTQPVGTRSKFPYPACKD